MLRVPHLVDSCDGAGVVGLPANLLRAHQPFGALVTPPALAADHGLRPEAQNSGAEVLKGEYALVWFPGDDLLSPLQRPRGLPIGNLTSQFWSNCYLDPFDHFIKRELRCGAYLRYVDDFAVFGDSKRQLGLSITAISQPVERRKSFATERYFFA